MRADPSRRRLGRPPKCVFGGVNHTDGQGSYALNSGLTRKAEGKPVTVSGRAHPRARGRTALQLHVAVDRASRKGPRLAWARQTHLALVPLGHRDRHASAQANARGLIHALFDPYRMRGSISIRMQRKSSAQWGFVGGLLLAGFGSGCLSTPTLARSVPASEDGTRWASAHSTELARDDERRATGTGRALPVRASMPRTGPVLSWLSPSHVAAAVRAQEPAFGACSTLGNSQSREGAVTVGWLVGTDGSVVDVTLDQSTFKSELVNDCVLSVARQVTFPASASTAQVFWTLRLRGEASGPLAEAGRYRERH